MTTFFTQRPGAQLQGVVILSLISLSACVQAADTGAVVPSITALFDEDGVLMMYPSAQGSQFRLGQQNPNHTPHFAIEKQVVARPQKEGALQYWNVPAYPLRYAGGGNGWSSRLHILASGGQQKYNWKNQHGYLSSPADVRNQELTVFMRVHQIVDPARAQITLKIRGGGHRADQPDAASCVMMTISPVAHGSITRFGKELQHPQYDYVSLQPAFPAALQDHVWIGLKLVSWNDVQDARRVIHRLYIDTDPLDLATGKPKNQWRLFSEYIDIEGKSSGRYNKLVNWGGCLTTIRADGFHDIDFVYPSVREIVPPQD